MQQVYIGTTNYGQHWLEPAAAASWARMVRDGCPAAGITDAGRTQQEQIDVFLKYFTTDFATSAKHDPRGWNGRTYWRRPGKPSAATPGSTTARHTFGRALDLNGATKAWVRANGHRYGWIRDLVRGEDWHMEYQPGRDAVAVSNPGTSVPTVPTVPDLPSLTPITPKERTVAVIHAIGSGDMYSTNFVTKVHLTTQGQVDDMLRVAGQGAPMVVGAETIAALPTYVAPVKPATPPTPAAIADEVWGRTIGDVKGVRRTAGQGVRLAAQAAAGDPVDSGPA